MKNAEYILSSWQAHNTGLSSLQWQLFHCSFCCCSQSILPTSLSLNISDKQKHSCSTTGDKLGAEENHSIGGSRYQQSHIRQDDTSSPRAIQWVHTGTKGDGDKAAACIQGPCMRWGWRQVIYSTRLSLPKTQALQEGWEQIQPKHSWGKRESPWHKLK